ncbi:HYR domain-containing protein [Nocardioides sp. URHA0032]|uniref:HYR domain-containing protein n=1 Tax=Nocardioides sp. URHA0032 TaxID=1380388 RepID=UPI000685CD09|nr:HYR domain-containing protein [Nocardioides sp. URHA0032]
MKSRLAWGSAGAAVLSIATAAAAVASPGVSPAHYSHALDPGGYVTITKTVETPPIPPQPDIVLMADTTGSMGSSIANVRSNAGSILGQVQAAQPTAQFAVAEYKDDESTSPFAYRVDQQLTGSAAAAVTGINAWSAGGGGDEPEAWLGALGQVPSTISFRPDSTRVLVMFGDAPSHDPSLGFTEGSATSGLVAAGVQVIAINVNGQNGAHLDSSGQATRVTAATGGSLAAADPDQVAATILSALRNLPAVVTHDTTCDPGVSLSFDQPARTVTSGDTTTFDETITLAGDAPQGQTVTCTTSFLVNGGLPGPEFVQTVEIAVNDVTPPVVTVESKTVEATSPSGASVSYDASAVDNVDGPLTPACTPPSGSTFALGATTVTCQATDAAGNTGTGTGTITVRDTTAPSVGCPEGPNPGGHVPGSHNPDGFFELVGTDAVDTAPRVFLRDTGSGTVWGPFASGQDVKYTENNAKPSIKQMPGGIWKITGTGDAEVFATDFSGNTSDPVACRVPPPPK